MTFPFTFPHYFPGGDEESTPLPDILTWAGIDYDSEIVDQGKSRLLHQYKGKPRIEALLAALLRPLQEARKASWDLFTLTNIDTATGVQLDTLGAIVGEPRRDRDDDTYRRWVRARIRANRSDGRVADFYAVLTLLYPEVSSRVLDRFPNSCEVIFDGDIDKLGPDVNRLIQFVRAAGHRAEFVFAVKDDPDYFNTMLFNIDNFAGVMG